MKRGGQKKPSSNSKKQSIPPQQQQPQHSMITRSSATSTAAGSSSSSVTDPPVATPAGVLRDSNTVTSDTSDSLNNVTTSLSSLRLDNEIGDQNLLSIIRKLQEDQKVNQGRIAQMEADRAAERADREAKRRADREAERADREAERAKYEAKILELQESIRQKDEALLEKIKEAEIADAAAIGSKVEKEDGIAHYDSDNSTFRAFRATMKRLFQQKLAKSVHAADAVRRAYALSYRGIISTHVLRDHSSIVLLFEEHGFEFSVDLTTLLTPLKAAPSWEAISILPNEFGETTLLKSLLAGHRNNADPDATTDRAKRWHRALTVLGSFHVSDHTLPEEPFRSQLWMKLLEALYPDNFTLIFPEYRVQSCVTNFGADQRIDLATALILKLPQLFHSFPFFAVEVSPYKGGKFDHKDFQKLACEMHAILFATVKIFEGVTRKELEQLRVYGLYTFGCEFQFCVMRPVFKDNMKRFVAVFETERHWRFSLDGVSSEGCEGKESCNLCRTRSLGLCLGQELTQEESANENDDIEPELSEETGLESKHGERSDLQGYGCSDTFPALLRLESFLEVVASYGRSLRELLKDKNERIRPTEFPKGMPSPPTSRSSHASSTPRSKQPQRSGASSKPSRTIVQLDNSKIYTVVTKLHVEQEVEFLQQLRGSRHVVELFHFEAQGGLVALVMEQLVSLRYQLSLDDASDRDVLYPMACQFVLDGLSAIKFVHDQGVVHRDISATNIMWSRMSHCWKLIDFDHACAMPSPGELIANNGCVGTPPFIAPEIRNGKDYSSSVDYYSFGKVFTEYFMGPLLYYSVYESEIERIAAFINNAGLAALNTRSHVRAMDGGLKSLRALSLYYQEKEIDVWSIHPGLMRYMPEGNLAIRSLAEDVRKELADPSSLLSLTVKQSLRDVTFQLTEPADPIVPSAVL